MWIARLPEDAPRQASDIWRAHTRTHTRTHTHTHTHTHAQTHTHAFTHTHAQAYLHRHARPPACAKVFKTSHVDVAATYANLGSVHRLLGEYDTALAYHHKARSHLGPSVPT